jgi:hypothetical protein
MKAHPVWFGAVVVAFLALAGCGPADPSDSPTTPPTSSQTSSPSAPEPSPTNFNSKHGVPMVVTSPLSGALVRSPLEVRGSVSGNWMFEASFGVKLMDADRRIVTEHPATAQGESMTSEPVSFKATLTFTAPTSDTGFLVLENANASGDPTTADSVEIPIRFR